MNGQPLLSAIRKNAELGKNMMETTLPLVKNNDLRAVVQVQFDEYNRFLMSADTLLRASGEISQNAVVARVIDSVSVGINTLTDKSTQNIAQLLVDSTVKGLREIDGAIERYGPASSPETINLGTTLRDFLNRNHRELKRFA